MFYTCTASFYSKSEKVFSRGDKIPLFEYKGLEFAEKKNFKKEYYPKRRVYKSVQN